MPGRSSDHLDHPDFVKVIVIDDHPAVAGRAGRAIATGGRAVVLYSAYVDPIFAIPATLAQADGIVETLTLRPEEVRARALRIIGELQARDRIAERRE